MMRCDITTRDLPTKRNFNTPPAGPFASVAYQIPEPEPVPVLKATITVRLGFHEVTVELDAPEMVLATDHYDNHANAKRVIERMVDQAFARFLK